jgi:hypothetical protein
MIMRALVHSQSNLTYPISLSLSIYLQDAGSRGPYLSLSGCGLATDPHALLAALDSSRSVSLLLFPHTLGASPSAVAQDPSRAIARAAPSIMPGVSKRRAHCDLTRVQIPSASLRCSMSTV